jgi:hypothetical protein
MEKLSKLGLVIIFIGIVYLFVKGYNYKKEIKEYPGETICRYTFCKQFPKTTESFVKYYVNNKLYRNATGRCPDDSDLKINKYYYLKYSTIDPNKIIVDFSKEVNDSTLIKELESKLEFKY